MNEVQYIPIDDVIPYENNPRDNDAAVEAVAASIDEFGFQQPLVCDKDMVLVVGHTRLKAAKRLGYTQVPVVVASELTDEQIRAYRLADNKTAERATWDFELLSEELEAITTIDMTQFDFDVSVDTDLDGLSGTDEIVDDNIPEDVPSICKEGDVWRLGRHRLMCGDSTSVDDVEALMDGSKADMVFCDAPYGYKYESGYQDKYGMLKNDDRILDFIPAIWGAMSDNCPVYEFCGWQSLRQWLEYFDGTGLTLKNVIIWKKNNWSMGDLKGSYAGQYEVILYLNKGRVELNGSRDTDIWEFDREPPKLHPTMKPIELIGYALDKSSTRGSLILDCFGGSGSTLIACEQLGRTCHMMELDAHYCDVIIQRWQDLTGEEAVLLSGEDS